MRAWAGLLVLVVLLAACGSSDGRVRVVPSAERPEDLYADASPTPSPAPVREVRVYFVVSEGLEPVLRLASGPPSTPEFMVRSLLAGPLPEERAAGLTSAIPEGTELLEVAVEDGLAEVNLSSEFELSAEEEVLLLRLGQVVFTLTGLRRVEGVRFLIDGEPVSVVAEDGETYEEVAREHYPSIAPRVPSTPSPHPEGPDA